MATEQKSCFDCRLHGTGDSPMTYPLAAESAISGKVSPDKIMTTLLSCEHIEAQPIASQPWPLTGIYGCRHHPCKGRMGCHRTTGFPLGHFVEFKQLLRARNRITSASLRCDRKFLVETESFACVDGVRLLMAPFPLRQEKMTLWSLHWARGRPSAKT
jgi:hypothetical protein